MGFKNYIIFSIVFMVAVWGYVFTLELGRHTVSFFGFQVSLPIDVWVVLPIFLLFLSTVFHILFYGVLNVFKQRAIAKDHETMIGLIKSSLLGKTNNKKLKTKGFKDLSSIISQFDLSVKDVNFTSTDADLNEIVAAIQDIKNGKYINEKPLKLIQGSTLSNQNLLNKVNEQVDFAVDVVKKAENYSPKIVRVAFLNVLEQKSMTTVKKLYKNIKLDKEIARKLFEKDAENNEFGFTNDEILKIVKDLEYTKEDYMVLAKNYETILKPDQIIALFEKLSSELDDATPAYLHVLFEYEMIDTIREIVAPTQEGEYTAFKALLELKDAGKHYDLESISYK